MEGCCPQLYSDKQSRLHVAWTTYRHLQQCKLHAECFSIQNGSNFTFSCTFSEERSSQGQDNKEFNREIACDRESAIITSYNTVRISMSFWQNVQRNLKPLNCLVPSYYIWSINSTFNSTVPSSTVIKYQALVNTYPPNCYLEASLSPPIQKPIKKEQLLLKGLQPHLESVFDCLQTVNSSSSPGESILSLIFYWFLN